MTNPTLSSPGWFGKLPGAGDFAHRRMPSSLRALWDDWLHDGLADLRARHPGWIDAYLTSPVWGFLLGPGVADNTAWIGAMAPSVDRVGRYYPISVFAPLPEHAIDPTLWWRTVHHLLIQALEEDADADDFENLLTASFTPSKRPSDTATPVQLRRPAFERSLWIDVSHLQAEPTMETEGLPRGSMFHLLFDLQTAATHWEDGA